MDSWKSCEACQLGQDFVSSCGRCLLWVMWDLSCECGVSWSVCSAAMLCCGGGGSAVNSICQWAGSYKEVCPDPIFLWDLLFTHKQRMRSARLTMQWVYYRAHCTPCSKLIQIWLLPSKQYAHNRRRTLSTLPAKGEVGKVIKRNALLHHLQRRHSKMMREREGERELVGGRVR